METTASPLRFALPVNRENRWSDLLATMIDLDAGPICELLEVRNDVTVHREEAADEQSRTDIVLRSEADTVAVIEAKVLAGLGRKQLERYAKAHPAAEAYAVLHPAGLAAGIDSGSKWRSLTWERVLEAYSESDNAWVAATATEWSAHLQSSLPSVDGDTKWRDLTPGQRYPVEIRTRLSWIYSNLHVAEPSEKSLGWSSAGNSVVARIERPVAISGYSLLVEVEDGCPVRSIPKHVPGNMQSVGPELRVLLRLRGVGSSVVFDWDLLLKMWGPMSAARSDWCTNRANPVAPHDKAQHARIVSLGAPKFLGIGFGEAQAKLTGSCAFGAKVRLSPDLTLDEIRLQMEGLEPLLDELSKIQPSRLRTRERRK